jgi:hypothetical protein
MNSQKLNMQNQKSLTTALASILNLYIDMAETIITQYIHFTIPVQFLPNSDLIVLG